MCEYSERYVKSSLEKALFILYDRDRELFVIDINERTLSHRLALYLEDLFPGYNVDCEYNRLDNRVKRTNYERCEYLRSKLSSADDTKGRSVYPDIIVHRRRTGNNLMAIEIKKSSSDIPDECDKLKLNSYKSDLGYTYAAFVKLKTDGSIEEPYIISWE